MNQRYSVTTKEKQLPPKRLNSDGRRQVRRKGGTFQLMSDVAVQRDKVAHEAAVKAKADKAAIDAAIQLTGTV